MKIGRIVGSTKYQLNKYFQTLLIFGILTVFQNEKIPDFFF